MFTSDGRDSKQGKMGTIGIEQKFWANGARAVKDTQLEGKILLHPAYLSDVAPSDYENRSMIGSLSKTYNCFDAVSSYYQKGGKKL